MSSENFIGYAYVVRNGNGQENLLAATFGSTRKKAKERLNSINHGMANQRRPVFRPVHMVKVEVVVLETIREYEVKPC